MRMDNSGRKDHLSVHSWIWGLRGTHGTAAAQLQLQQGPAELRGRFQPAGGRSRPTRPRCPGPGTADLRAPPSSGPRPALRDRGAPAAGTATRPAAIAAPTHPGLRDRPDTRPAALPAPATPNPPPLPSRAPPLLPEQPGGCTAHGCRSSAGPRPAPRLALAWGDSGAAVAELGASGPRLRRCRPAHARTGGRGCSDAAAGRAPHKDGGAERLRASAALHKDGGASRLAVSAALHKDGGT